MRRSIAAVGLAGLLAAVLELGGAAPAVAKGDPVAPGTVAVLTLTPTAQLSGESQVGPISGSKAITIDVTSWNVGVISAPNIGSQATGAGKVTWQPLTITKQIDATSPLLLQAAAEGLHFASGELDILQPGGPQGHAGRGGAPPSGLTFQLKDVIVESATFSGGSAGDQEQDVLEFASVALTTPTGSSTTLAPGSWNRVYNSTSTISTTIAS